MAAEVIRDYPAESQEEQTYVEGESGIWYPTEKIPDENLGQRDRLVSE